MAKQMTASPPAPTTTSGFARFLAAADGEEVDPITGGDARQRETRTVSTCAAQDQRAASSVLDQAVGLAVDRDLRVVDPLEDEILEPLLHRPGRVDPRVDEVAGSRGRDVDLLSVGGADAA